ncbi:MAG: substrate-binding domain-containing protein [Christensenellales bacterium]
MRKVIGIFLSLLLALSIFGCSAYTAPTEGQKTSASPSAQPTPEPVGIERVFGKKELIAAVVSNGSEEESRLFFDAAAAEGSALGVTVQTKAAGKDFTAAVKNAVQGADCLIVYLPHGLAEGSAFEGLQIPVCVFRKDEAPAPKDASVITYDGAEEVELSLEAVLNYPPHDTPVRLFGLFTSKNSEASTAYDQLISEGKVMSKRTWYAEGGTEAAQTAQPASAAERAKQWVTERLNGYFPGMVDAIYAETEELAVAALDALEEAGRDDMEVITVGVSGQTLSRMKANPSVFVQTIGCNDALAGYKCIRISLGMVKGGGVASETLKPVVINAPTGETSFADYLVQGADIGYEQDYMAQLREYYARN